MTPRVLVALLLGASLRMTGAQEAPPTQATAGIASPMIVAKVPSEFGKIALARFRERYPGLLVGRVALGWPATDREAAAAGRAAVDAEPALRPLADLGVTAGSAEAALDQMDPETFSGVLWLESLKGNDGTFSGLSLTLRRPGIPEEMKLSLTSLSAPSALPPPAPAQGGTPTAPEPIFQVAGQVRAMAAPEEGGELWFLLGGRLVRRTLSGGSSPQEWPLEGAGAPDSPCVLRLLSEGGSATRLGWACGGDGEWLVVGGSGIKRLSPLDGFPLSERESKFLRAPFLPEAGTYVLLDFQGKELAAFTGFTRTRSASGESFLVLLQKDGAAKAFRGNTLEALVPPAEGAFAALAGMGDRVALAEAGPPYRIRVFRALEGPTWEALWDSGSLPGPARFLALGCFAGRNAACAMVAEGDGTQAFLLPLP